MSMKWYTLHILSGKEKKIEEQIHKLLRIEACQEVLGELLFPIKQTTEIKRDKKIVRKKRLFPGYMFINIDLKSEDDVLNKDLIMKIKSLEGIINFLGGLVPKTISVKEIEKIKLKIEESKVKDSPEIDLKIGETVRVKEGAFKDLQGEVALIDKDKGKLQIILNIFDRATTIDNIEYWQVEKIV